MHIGKKLEEKPNNNKSNLYEIFKLYLSFFRIGITTFGGGVMMIANLKRELVDKRKWISEKEMYDYIAIAQVTPGVIMVNSATIIGMKQNGFLGSLFATIAVVTPSLIIITFLSFALSYFSSLYLYIAKFLIGVRIAVCATSISVIYRMVKSNIKDTAQAIIAIIAFIASVFFNIPSSILIVSAILIGIVLRFSIQKNA